MFLEFLKRFKDHKIIQTRKKMTLRTKIVKFAGYIVGKHGIEVIYDELHKGHHGVTRTLQDVRQSIYWHGINQDVKSMYKNCRKCQTLRNLTYKEPF